jgi:hypothetical protein
MSSISSVSPAPILKPVEASAPKAPDVKINDADTRTAPPPPPVPLPPGQGTRVNIFA